MVALVGFLLPAVVLPLPICAAEATVGWASQKTPDAPLTNLTKIAALRLSFFSLAPSTIPTEFSMLTERSADASFHHF
jgi:hypothetical protein